MNISLVNPNPLSPPSGDALGRMLGSVLQDMGKIGPEDAERIVQMQRKKGLRFGEAAIRLRLATGADIARALAIQFDYSYLSGDAGRLGRELVAAYQPFSAEAEALRALRSQLALRWFGKGNRMLAVIAPHPGDGCSALAANLAVVFSQLGEKTLLVDANLRQPAQHDLFGLRGRRGLTDILIGRAGLEAIGRIDALDSLSLLGAGAVPPNPQELLNRKGFGALMDELRTLYDIVIVDTAPAIGTADAQVVAMRCGGALLASRIDVTPLRDLVNVRDQLLVGDVQIVAGVVQ